MRGASSVIGLRRKASGRVGNVKKTDASLIQPIVVGID
jgi:hypothetical protein